MVIWLRKRLRWLQERLSGPRQRVDAFNERVAQKLANWLASMALAYWLTFVIFLSLHWQTPEGVIGWIQFIVQTFFQGVALPILALVAKLDGSWTRRMLQQILDTVMAELAMVRDEQAAIRGMVSDVHALLTGESDIKAYFESEQKDRAALLMLMDRIDARLRGENTSGQT